MAALCNKCGECVKACSVLAISLESDGTPRIDRQRCTKCGDCARACFPRALIIYGEEKTAAEVLEEVNRDKMFYDGTGGGVTVSGGEPLFQPAFVRAIFALCRSESIHTALETCGLASRQAWEEVLPVTDYLLFDLKHLNAEAHREFTGVANDQILENARRVVTSGVPVLFRCPLVPGVNDTSENIRETASFLSALQGEKAAIEFLPYHRLGVPKYQALDRTYRLNALQSLLPNSAHVLSVQRAYEEMGVKCTISI